MYSLVQGLTHQQGRSVAQAVSPGWHVGFVVDKAVLGQVFSEYFRFPCPPSFHQFLQHHNHLGLAQ
jgi:hypothetical protein